MTYKIDKIEILKGETETIQIRTIAQETLFDSAGNEVLIDKGFHRFSATAETDPTTFPDNVRAEFEKYITFVAPLVEEAP